MKSGLELKLAVLLLATVILGAVAGAALYRYSGGHWQPVIFSAVITLAAAILGARVVLRPLRRMLRGMHRIVAGYRDGDFNQSLAVDRDDQLGALMEAHNQLGRTLREERSNLVQRERLLDTVTRHSPVALILVDADQQVVYTNLAAGALLNGGRGFVGQNLASVLARAPAPLRLAAEARGDSLFSAEMASIEETFHLSQREFLLQGRAHRLYLLKTVTREISRQEVTTWKNLIRVLSHELNNSLAPIASLALSGGKLNDRGQTAELTAIFATIRERAMHLHQFISSYAAFAKLPAPRPGRVEWSVLVDLLAREQAFVVRDALPSRPGWFDCSQVEQALINLLKNAHESNGAAQHVELAISCCENEQRLEVRDRGTGMSKLVLAQALLPFYSTKRNGTGIGLALAREISEAHGGRISIANREGGGLCVTLILPIAVTPEPAAIPL
jgi:two-component system nitrogen regulation sensor histidine kinase NtrY